MGQLYGELSHLLSYGRCGKKGMRGSSGEYYGCGGFCALSIHADCQVDFI